MIVIGDDTSVQEMWVRGNHAEVTVTYRELGRIDSSLRYSPSDPRIPKVVRRYQLIHAAAPTGTGESTAEIPGPRGWRIQNPPAFVLIGINAAIQHVNQMRDSATSPIQKKNADTTLGQLKRLH
jgi:hypothetical protein